MAPPQIHKRALPPEPPDVGNRVSKPTLSTSRTNGNSITKVRSSRNAVDALCKGIAFEKTCGAAQVSDIEQVQVVPMECEDKLQTVEENEFGFDEEFPPLIETANSTYNIVDQNESSPQKNSAAPLMAAIKGLLDLTNNYLQNLDKEYPGVGADFLALLADGASRVMRGEKVYASFHNTSKLNTNSLKATWAQKVASDVHDPKSPDKKQRLKSSLPGGQSKEDRRVMIRLSPC